MFVVQGVGVVLSDPPAVRHHQEAYDSLLHQTPGIVWNVYLRGDPNRSIHLMGWREQDDSEGFGVSPAFQKMRSETPQTGSPRSQMVGPLSPGYWDLLHDRAIAPPPTGRDESTLGFARHAMIFVRPGREHEFERLVGNQIDALPGDGSVFTARLLRNLGRPNAYTFVVHTRSRANAEAITLPAETIEHLDDAVYWVTMSSDWPTN
ncbi:MAG: hypothetical protein U0556_07275 [Dehalococcoidia bacterium]